MKLGKRHGRQTVRHVNLAGGDRLCPGIVKSYFKRLLALNRVHKQDDRKISLNECALAKRHVGVTVLNGLQVRSGQVIAAGDKFVGVVGVELAEARDVGSA